MAESIVSAILEQLTAITIGKASEAWCLVRGVEEEVRRLERNFKSLQLELEDAEEREYQDKRLKHWLDKFRDVSYDMEDVLDDWKLAIGQLQSVGGSVRKWKVRPFFSCFSSGPQTVRRYGIATKIKGINEQLDQIVNDQVRFELIKKKENKEHKRRLETTSFVDVSELIGRDAVKEDIIRILLCNESSRNTPTISIVGMGGTGKSALAQLVYNDSRIQAHFSKIIWICASDPFDQSQIARAILADLDLDTFVSLTTPTLQNVLRIISEKIKAMKFMFVFDDVWTDSDRDWEPLKAAFKYGMSGSWFLVTTRKESVARRMESSHVVPLELLPDKMCWLILAQKAFIGRNHLSCENLEDIGKEIAKKCRVHEFVRFLTQDRFVTKKLVGSSTLDLSSSKARHLRLGIQNCCLNLQKLADGIGKLINLSYLCTNDCPRLTYYPKGISNLTSLERLSGIKMRIDQNDGDHLSIGDLENLDLLGGNLSVELIGDTLDWNEAERAKLHKKIHLKRMDIWICSEAIKKEELQLGHHHQFLQKVMRIQQLEKKHETDKNLKAYCQLRLVTLMVKKKTWGTEC
ncbi:hypothetical protein V6N12_023990 [Hibiscus sabdariffa]|uniref:Uncharacterized protein n=1 Tax=Hibiscus sabdariffa TaxID=183260 RepID=A0ABR2FZ99_9ROSI